MTAARTPGPPVEVEEPMPAPQSQSTPVPTWILGLMTTALLGAIAAVYGATASRAGEVEARTIAAIVEVKARQDRTDARVGALESSDAKRGAQLDAIQQTTQRIEASVHDLAAELAAARPQRKP